MDERFNHLLFESRFESGNLRIAIQVAPYHYRLVLSPDINQFREHYQWFYFEIANNEANVDYTFEIVSCKKVKSMFNSGMLPAFFSVTNFSQKGVGWTRAGKSVMYYLNSFKDHPIEIADERSDCERSYYTLRFILNFEHAADVCYIAYHFPYTFTRLQATLQTTPNIMFTFYERIDHLCNSLGGNPVSIVTLTGNKSKVSFKKRDLIFITARVHPGESNSSWIMHGLIEFLRSQHRIAVELRERYIFKLIPMLNPDGVIHGNHRCDLTGHDVNRVWSDPDEHIQPVVFHVKKVIEYAVKVLKKMPFLYIDLHGHSKHPNLFLFGNNPQESWYISDHSVKHNSEFMVLPDLLQKHSNYFSRSECSFKIVKSKESSARVVMWRQFGIVRSYTIESTFAGFDKGIHRGCQVTISNLEEMGRDLCKSIFFLCSKNKSHLKERSLSETPVLRSKRQIDLSDKAVLSD